MDCKKALEEAGGNEEKAIEILRKKGIDTAAKKSGRQTKEGRVLSYIHHNGRLGVLLEVNCETDFVGRNPEFEAFTKDLAMQVAAARPSYLSREQVPQSVVDKEREIYAEQVKGKPPQARQKIIEGKLNKFFSECCLLEQPTVKDPSITVQDRLRQIVGKLGENIVVRRFARFEVGTEG